MINKSLNYTIMAHYTHPWFSFSRKSKRNRWTYFSSLETQLLFINPNKTKTISIFQRCSFNVYKCYYINNCVFDLFQKLESFQELELLKDQFRYWILCIVTFVEFENSNCSRCRCFLCFSAPNLRQNNNKTWKVSFWVTKKKKHKFCETQKVHGIIMFPFQISK